MTTTSGILFGDLVRQLVAGHTFATWAIENRARELDVQYLLGHSTSAMVLCGTKTRSCVQAALR